MSDNKPVVAVCRDQASNMPKQIKNNSKEKDDYCNCGNCTDSSKNGQPNKCGQDAVGRAEIKTCVPIQIVPNAKVGELVVRCCGEPQLTCCSEYQCGCKCNGTNAHCYGETSCQMMIYQTLSIEIPVSYSVSSHAGIASIVLECDSGDGSQCADSNDANELDVGDECIATTKTSSDGKICQHCNKSIP